VRRRRREEEKEKDEEEAAREGGEGGRRRLTPFDRSATLSHVLVLRRSHRANWCRGALPPVD
jgi:hypothetical protein